MPGAVTYGSRLPVSHQSAAEIAYLSDQSQHVLAGRGRQAGRDGTEPGGAKVQRPDAHARDGATSAAPPPSPHTHPSPSDRVVFRLMRQLLSPGISPHLRRWTDGVCKECAWVVLYSYT